MPSNQLNKNVGVGGMDVGLCLIPTTGGNSPSELFELDINEAGLIEATISFATFQPAFTPARGTLCPNFRAGNALTRALLASLTYLGAQSQKIRWNGEGDGIHGVDVLCQGALFNTGISAAPVLSVPITDGGNYTAIPTVVFSGGQEITPAQAVALLQWSTISLANGGSGYHVGDILILSGGTFAQPVTIQVDAVAAGGGGAITSYHIVAYGQYSVVPGNPVSVTGGTGSGAQFTLTWELGVISITAGGQYSDTPTVSLNGGTFSEAGSLGAVTMGQRQLIGGDVLTLPFDPVTTVKDTVDIPLQTLSGGGGGGHLYSVRCATTGGGLGAFAVGNNPGNPAQTRLTGNTGALLPQDGVSLNVGDKVLVLDIGNNSLVFAVIALGSGAPPPAPHMNWAMDEVLGDPISSGDQVNVSEGSANAGLWQCTGVSPLAWARAAGGGGGITQTVGYKVTVDYHAIELNFEYMARDFASNPRFLQNEYNLNEGGKILISPVTGRAMTLEIDSASAITQVIDSSGNVSDGSPVAITDAQWRAGVKYVGTAAQFEQTPAGAYWSVKETATIKIVPILAALPPEPVSS